MHPPFFFLNKQNKESYDPAHRKAAFSTSKNTVKEVWIKNYHQFFFETISSFPKSFQRELLDNIKKNPQCFEALFQLGIFYRDIGELNKAEHSYRASLAIKRDHDVLNYLGCLLVDKAALLREEAEASFLASIEIEPYGDHTSI